MKPVECAEGELRDRLATLPRSTTNRRGTREGDPLNLVAVGNLAAILSGFGARWDETESIDLPSCWRMVKAFLLGTHFCVAPRSWR